MVIKDKDFYTGYAHIKRIAPKLINAHVSLFRTFIGFYVKAVVIGYDGILWKITLSEKAVTRLINTRFFAKDCDAFITIFQFPVTWNALGIGRFACVCWSIG